MTGAGRGLGATYATLAAREGASVVVNDIDADEALAVVQTITAEGGQATAYVADIGSWSAAESLVACALDTFGGLDGLVSNAGLFHTALAKDQDEASFRRLMDVNVIGLAACGVHAIRHMVRQGHGSIVNVTSGAFAGMSGVSAYGASKGAVVSLTYTWALELAGSGVRVNAISPFAGTRMVREMYRFHEGEQGWAADAFQSLPQPAVNAPTVVYLLSELAADVNGQVVQISGKSLSLLAGPAVLEPTVRGGTVSIEAVADAFAGQFADRLQSPGLGRTGDRRDR